MGWKELVILVGFLAGWFALNRWVLPWFGVSTCLSGSCAVSARPAETEPVPKGSEQGGDVR